MPEINRKDRIIVALDTHNKAACEKLISDLSGVIKIFKIGSELFNSFGARVVEYTLGSGAQVFLDLKFHDIPNTVAQASRIASRLGVQMFNVHTSGGGKMMEAARKAVQQENPSQKPLVLGVTILTSLDEKNMQEIYGKEISLKDKVLQLAKSAKDSGLDGVVASAKEVTMIKKELGKDFVVVTPGVRPSWSEKGDQKRVVTPKEAFELGADYIVIGRPVTQAKESRDAVNRILDELE